MAKKETCNSCEQFKTMIGGQALIEGIMMRGPEKDAIVCRGRDGLTLEVTQRKLPKEGSPLKWPLIRGVVNFFDAQVTGVRALLKSADLSPDGSYDDEPSKLDMWLEKKLGSERFQQYLIYGAAVLGILFSIGLFFLLPMIISGFFDSVIESQVVIHLIEGLVRMVIFMAYIVLVSRMKEMKRVFAYHGAEHKTIRCYEAKLPLTEECPGADPAAPPVRHQLPAGGHDPVHPGFQRGSLRFAGGISRTGCIGGHLPVPAYQDRLQAAAASPGGGHRLRDQPLGGPHRQCLYPQPDGPRPVDAELYHQ